MANLRMTSLVLLCSTVLACGSDDDGTAESTMTTMTMTTAPATDSSDSGPTPTTMTTTAEDSTSGGPSGSEGTTAVDPDTSSGPGADESTTAAVVSASATLEPKSGSMAMGSAMFTANGRDWSDLVIDLQGVMPPGTHALHIHVFPDCSAEDGTSTGDHWNPRGTMLGELGTVEIAEDGTGTFTKSDAWSIGTGAENDVVGRSIIIHQNPDGGPRIACGVIELD
jgi:superoxide dismutase, Cu-Zn family